MNLILCFETHTQKRSAEKKSDKSERSGSIIITNIQLDECQPISNLFNLIVANCIPLNTINLRKFFFRIVRQFHVEIYWRCHSEFQKETHFDVFCQVIQTNRQHRMSNINHRPILLHMNSFVAKMKGIWVDYSKKSTRNYSFHQSSLITILFMMIFIWAINPFGIFIRWHLLKWSFAPDEDYLVVFSLT